MKEEQITIEDHHGNFERRGIVNNTLSPKVEIKKEDEDLERKNNRNVNSNNRSPIRNNNSIRMSIDAGELHQIRKFVEEESTYQNTTTSELSEVDTNTTSTSKKTWEDEQVIENWRKSYQKRRISKVQPPNKCQDDITIDYPLKLPARYFLDDISRGQRIPKSNTSKIIISSHNKNIHITESMSNIEDKDFSSDDESSSIKKPNKNNRKKAYLDNSEISSSSGVNLLLSRKSSNQSIRSSDNFQNNNNPSITLQQPMSPRSPTLQNSNNIVQSSPFPLSPTNANSNLNFPTTTSPITPISNNIFNNNLLSPTTRRYINHIRQESLYIDDEMPHDDDFVLKKEDMEMIEQTKEIPKSKQVEAYNVNDYLNMKPITDQIVSVKDNLSNNYLTRKLWKIDETMDEFSDDELEPSAITAPPTITETNDDKPKQEEEKRYEAVHLNNRQENKNCRKRWPSNYIRTTKYTFLTFIPKNLFEQFRRVSNIYFLISVLLVLIPSVSPTFPITSIIPLVTIIGLTMIKDGLEDLQRYVQDRRANNEKCRVIRNGKLVEIKVSTVEIGDIVYVKKEETFPADLLCIYSSREDSICYVETANLDGETNLKTRRAMKIGNVLHSLPEHTIHTELNELKGRLKIEQASNNLDSFQGKIKVHYKNKETAKKETIKEPISMDNLLLRGCVLKNTKLIYGVALYVGSDTKVQKNLKESKVKFSHLDRTLNRMLIFLLVSQQFICGLFALFSSLFQASDGVRSFYIRAVNPNYPSFVSVVLDWITGFLLLNLMIPMSLMVSLEFIKTFQAKLIEADNELKYGKFSAEVKSSNLNQSLSQLDIIFSDKTGTLTQNEMKYSDSWVGGCYYSELESPGSMMNHLSKQLNWNTSEDEPSASDTAAYHAFLVKEFLLCLALNHSVIPERDTNNPENIIYDGPSSDELALLEAARSNGFKLLQRTNAGLLVEINGEKKFYEVKATIDFSSDRKRMSVVVKTPEGKYICYVKGADSVMLKRARARKQFVHDLKVALETFSIRGLRTLVCARKEIPEQEFNFWYENYNKAIISLKNRDKQIAHSAADLEIDLQLLGCTAIEDKLQEEVPESIAFLKKAGFDIWVLTGDKTETAIEIGYRTNVLHKDETIEIRIRDAVSHKHVKKKMKIALDFLDRNKNKNFNYALIVDSKSLDFALEKYEKQFLRIVKYVNSAVCCRLKPLQKARIVKLIESKLKKQSLSIGDGVNDVAMIQAATIGVGIKGKEGAQAARSGDYSLPRFRHLIRLLAVHGRYCYVRNSDFLHLSFYKNIIVVVSQLLFCFCNGVTGSTFFDSWVLTMYNTIYAFFQPIMMGTFEKDVNEEVLLKHPELYITLKNNALFNYKTLIIWILNGIYHTVIIFLGVLFSSTTDDLLAPKVTDIFHFGTVIMTCTMFVITFRFALEEKYWTFISHIAIWGSLVSYFAFVVVYSAVPIFMGKSNYHFNFYETLLSPKANIVTLLVVVVSIIPDLIVKFVQFNYFPHDYQILLKQYLSEKKKNNTTVDTNGIKENTIEHNNNNNTVDVIVPDLSMHNNPTTHATAHTASSEYSPSTEIINKI
ncbi:hypothetical protein ABK040_008481 [Willaertia magna]